MQISKNVLENRAVFNGVVSGLTHVVSVSNQIESSSFQQSVCDDNLEHLAILDKVERIVSNYKNKQGISIEYVLGIQYSEKVLVLDIQYIL